jgi:oxygen-independent coproporphyrinogen-3 oxidase
MKFLRGHFIFGPDCEITIEANPDDINAEKSQCLSDLGINRVSLGLQTFDDRYLKFLGRTHDAARAQAAFECLRSAGFGNINVDLMYGFPGQSQEELNNDARRLADLGSEHVSVYTLTVEPNSRFYARQMKLDDEEKLARHYVLVTQALETAGLRQYEISNFARDGYESRHNSHYWTGGDYIGLGMGAHSHAAGRRFWNEDKLLPYLEKINAAGNAVAGEESLSLRQRLGERFVLGLRTNKGVDHAAIEDEIGCRLEKDILQQVADLTAEGFLEKEGTTVRATMKGRLVLDDISARLI